MSSLARISIALLSFFLFFIDANAQNCKYKNFNIKISQEVTIYDMIEKLSNRCEFSTIIKDTQAKKFLSLKLSGINIKNLSLQKVFDLILTENNINYTFKDNLLRLYALKTKIFHLDYITSVRQGTANLSASVEAETVEGFGLKDAINKTDNQIKVEEKFDFWNTINSEIKALLNNGSETYIAKNPIINQNTGLITITATNSQLKRVERYINELRKRLHKQVMIDVSIIAVELSNSYTFGIDWSKFQLSINSHQNSSNDMVSDADSGLLATFNNTLQNSTNALTITNNIHFSMEGLLNFIKKNGKSKVLSNPKVMTLNNQQALITIGDTINYRMPINTTNDESGRTKVTYTPYSIFIGVLLNLLPEVSNDNKIMLRINPSLSNFKYAEDDKKQLNAREIAPDTLEKKLSTVVQVSSGDTIILGGLIGQTKGKTDTSVPFLSSIPLLGALFKSSSDMVKTTELVFVITPYIIDVNRKHDVKKSLKDLGFSESMYE